MKLTMTDRTSWVTEKDLGEDDTGRPMIVDLVFWSETYESDIDIRESMMATRGSWYLCKWKIEKDSPLMKAMKERFLDTWTKGRMPMLHGIRWVSDDGKKFQFCWR